MSVDSSVPPTSGDYPLEVVAAAAAWDELFLGGAIDDRRGFLRKGLGKGRDLECGFNISTKAPIWGKILGKFLHTRVVSL